MYLASPLADQEEHKAIYRAIYHIIDNMPELGIHSFDIRVLGMNDGLTKGAIEATRPNLSRPNAKPYRGITRFSGSNLGGVEVDGAYIYPPQETLVPS